MNYKIDDFVEATIGAMSSLLFFFALRSDPGPFIHPLIGFLITALWLIILASGYEALVKDLKDKWVHFSIGILITFMVATGLSLIFNAAEPSHYLGFQLFGSPGIVGLWMGLPFALLFDIRNIKSIFKKYYTGG